MNGEGGGGLNGAGGGDFGGGCRRGEWAAPGSVGGDGVVDGDGEAARQPGGVVRCVKGRAKLTLGAGIYIPWTFSTGL